MATFSHGHDWGWRMMACSRCGVQLTDYERGEPYQCGATPEPTDWRENSKGALVTPAPDGGFFVKPKPATPEPREWQGKAKLVRVTNVDGVEIPPDRVKFERLETGSYKLTVFEAETSGTCTVNLGTVPKGAILRGIGPNGPIYDTPATVTNTGVTQTKRCKQFEMMGFHVRRGMNEEACVFCGRSEQDLATAGEPMRTGAESVFTHEGKNPLDRALEDFIARREAKRKATAIEMRDHEDAKFMARSIEELDRAQILAEAMTLPISFTARMGGKQP